ncbi:uncharacterized protein [Watersipora subatra]|uniref:uncharacterized protein n=1 Tax=Watersipora subatra TaxID=2589382 RepID=UPI00355C7DFB
MASSRNGSVTTNGSSLSNGHSKQDKTATESSMLPHLLTNVIFPSTLVFLGPTFLMWIWYSVVFHNGSYYDFFSTAAKSDNAVGYLLSVWSKVSFGSFLSLSIIGGYMIFQLMLTFLVPGKRVEGPMTPTGHVPVYKDNGFSIYIITMISFVLLTTYLKLYTPYSPSIVYDEFGSLLANMNTFAWLFCVLLYVKGIVAPSSKDCGTSGNPVFDYYWGTELYPRILGVDVKVFTNCRFGCTVWALLPCCFAMKAYELHGFDASINSFVSVAILVVYLTKFFWWEAGYMCTIDIILDRAGFYICWGCLCFIPGLYASFSFYLVSHPIALSYPLAFAIVAAGLTCIAVNYDADWQRQHVRATDGQTTIWGKKPEVIRAKYRTSQGEEKSSLLLVSGFWGLARHFHYLPELGLALCWSIPCGFDHILPYTYLIFLTLLLIHRTHRDDLKCSDKYGIYWRQYKSKVPYKIIPYIF